MNGGWRSKGENEEPFVALRTHLLPDIIDATVVGLDSIGWRQDMVLQLDRSLNLMGSEGGGEQASRVVGLLKNEHELRLIGVRKRVPDKGSQKLKCS